ncbi:MAG: hypothetical protein GY813_00350 [Halieaceae bacterium]|nr:hypothetical protein [Halieaceae bacterium]
MSVHLLLLEELDGEVVGGVPGPLEEQHLVVVLVGGEHDLPAGLPQRVAGPGSRAEQRYHAVLVPARPGSVTHHRPAVCSVQCAV